MEAKKLELHERHQQLGAKMTPFAGYEMPLRYSSDIEEHQTVRTAAGIFDVSHMGEFIVDGPKALELIQLITCNDASKIAIGQAQYACLMNHAGGVVDDLLVYRLEEEKYLLVVNASNIEKDWEWISSNNTAGAALQNVSDETCLFAVQGPKATAILQKLTHINLQEIKYYHVVSGKIGGVEDVIISATGYTGSGGFELFVTRRNAETLWDAIFVAGSEVGLKPVGLGARDTLRLEMGFCLYGHELNDETTPLEAGLGWIVKLHKDFLGADKLKEQKQNGITRKLVGFEMIDKGIPRQGYELLNEQEERIGFVTSGTQGPSLGVGVGMGYVNAQYVAPGARLMVRVRNKILAARVVKTPFYKKD